MKQAIVMGILTALFMTVLTACGKSAESNGNTKRIAEQIQKATGVDIARIETVTEVLRLEREDSGSVSDARRMAGS